MVSLSDSARGLGRSIPSERLIKRSTSLISRAVCRVTLFINLGGFMIIICILLLFVLLKRKEP